MSAESLCTPSTATLMVTTSPRQNHLCRTYFRWYRYLPGRLWRSPGVPSCRRLLEAGRDCVHWRWMCQKEQVLLLRRCGTIRQLDPERYEQILNIKLKLIPKK